MTFQQAPGPWKKAPCVRGQGEQCTLLPESRAAHNTHEWEGAGEAGFCLDVKSHEGVEQICSLGCFGEAGALNPDSSLSIQGSTSVQTMTESFFQLTGEHPAEVLVRQRMTHADNAAGESYEVTVSL